MGHYFYYYCMSDYTSMPNSIKRAAKQPYKPTMDELLNGTGMPSHISVQDTTEPYSEANIAAGLRWLASFKYPPSWGKDIVLPPVFAVAKEGASQAAKHITKEAEKEIKFMLPNPYEGLINEAVNRHISK
jgi:hypothetical protein